MEGRPVRAHGRHEPASLVGLLAERVLRVADLDEAAPGAHPGPATEHGNLLGRVLSHEGRLVQLVTVSDLLPPDVLRDLVRGEPVVGDA